MKSTIPGAVDALVALTGRVLPGVQVWDGPPHGDVADEMVCIGYAGDDSDETVVESNRTREQATNDPDHESYTITSAVYVWKGDQESAKVVRDRVYELVDAIGAELAADPTMGGTVARALLSTEALAQTQTTAGAAAGVRFVVSVDAWTG